VASHTGGGLFGHRPGEKPSLANIARVHPGAGFVCLQDVLMKRTLLFSLLLGTLLSTRCPGFGQDLIELDRGPHHRTWGRVQEIQTPRGARYRTNTAIVELQGGLHRWDADQNKYVVSSPRIEPFQDGAVVRGLQYSVIFAPNLATAGALDLQLPDSQGRLSGHLLGLAYTEGARSVLVAEVTDCAAEISGSEQNILTFRNAFTDYAIDVQYVVTRERFSQNLILRERLKSPLEYGLSENAHLEVLTEWIAAPPITKETRIIEPAQDGQRALTDERIILGTMQFLGGRAFSVGDAETAREIPTWKSWEEIPDQGTNRTFLIEKIPWRQVQPELQNLPAPQARVTPGRDGPPGQPTTTLLAQNGAPGGRAIPWRTFANLPARRAKRPALKPIQLASLEVGRSGFNVQGSRFGASRFQLPRAFVIDFELVQTITNACFRADVTYYVSGPVTVANNVFEGGCIVKYAPTNTAKITLTGPVVCRTSSHRPLILTARDDHTAGESIGTNALSGYYAQYALYLNYYSGSNVFDLRHVHIRHADTAVGSYCARAPASEPGVLLWHCQWVNCRVGIWSYWSTFSLHNLLAWNLDRLIDGSGCTSATGRLQHVTLHQANYLHPSNCVITVTNSLFICVTNIPISTKSWCSANGAIEPNDMGVFQTVGPGSHYLAANSTNRNTGTPNINADLAADLRQRTTYPPLVLSNQPVTIDTTFLPQAQRDTDQQDRGYHYAPIDYAVNVLTVSNATLTLGEGCVLATYGNCGIWLADQSRLVSQGSPLRRNHVCRYNAVQEGVSNWGNGSVSANCAINPYNWSGSPSLSLRFTDFEGLASGGGHFYSLDDEGSGVGWIVTNLTAWGCSFHAGAVTLGGKATSTFCLSNNIFERVPFTLYSVSSLWCQNNLFRTNYCQLWNAGSNEWAFHDNVFENCVLDPYGPMTNSHNGYIGMSSRLEPTNGTEVIYSSVDWQEAPLGWFDLLPTYPLIDSGSRTNSGQVGLYQYTCKANQAKDGYTRLDLGHHYVALDAYGQPFDYDSDGLPDYLEDLNGNGAFDAGTAETSWTNYTSIHGIGPGPGLILFTPLK
jgi:hypothetical protein